MHPQQNHSLICGPMGKYLRMELLKVHLQHLQILSSLENLKGTTKCWRCSQVLHENNYIFWCLRGGRRHEGVPALIYQSEVSWDATLDPESYFKVGQIIDAKVHQLDFSLERIFLSLKEITPVPLIEALESVVGDHDSLGDELEAIQENSKWADVESLLKELLQFEGIQSVSTRLYFLSPGLVPTFQVYMASMFENQYKLLARAGNRVQEVIVETSLDKELKSTILTCTNRVE